MSDWLDPSRRRAVEELYSAHGETALPIHLVGSDTAIDAIAGLTTAQRAWLTANGFQSAIPKRQIGLPAADGTLAGIALAIGAGETGEPCGPSDLLVGQVAQSCRPGCYSLAGKVTNVSLAAVAWGLGAYRFGNYKSPPQTSTVARLRLPEGVDAASVAAIVEATWLGRDLINTPASDLGPAELEAAAAALAARHGADIEVTVGDDLLDRKFPMIHAVGRASTRPPRLIDMTWSKPGGSASAPRLTLVGKGICFDTGGLDIKPASGMLLMKKDMGGAAVALSLAHMIMSHGLDVRLRVLIAAAENSIDGNAFRPSDVLMSRAGLTVEVGNTDAEGRLVLADALALADEEGPDMLLCFATLTGAARVALGPDLPALFTDDAALADVLVDAGERVGDPMWRMPLWRGYDRNLDSEVADMGNVSDGPFAGAITAALFLRRFVGKARQFAHFDLYGWRPSPRALGPKGGEPQTARAIFEALRSEGGLL
ncbi:MAG: leucyl aminopeptidase family protein [Hyphomicrobiaceae bacterium]|nr:leucyl aminopeptidase family protein [Hyphomicrobiaceae bacterium]